ncbi:hypothetical protein ABZ860_41830 [Microbispora sp. NPDC046973]|uniref:hypothetical protein n=1 Tax=Microbispora sp. NPDC046973 TaxID=3155022 RepID=UPI0033CBB17C
MDTTPATMSVQPSNPALRRRGLRRLFTAGLTSVLLSASIGLTSASPAHAAGGCVNKSQNGWTIRLCASKDWTTVYSDFYILSKGQMGNGCYLEGVYRVGWGPDGWYGFGSCQNLALNTRYIIGTTTVFGGADVTTRVHVFESAYPFRDWFDQSASYTGV